MATVEHGTTRTDENHLEFAQNTNTNHTPGHDINAPHDVR